MYESVFDTRETNTDRAVCVRGDLYLKRNKTLTTMKESRDEGDSKESNLPDKKRAKKGHTGDKNIPAHRQVPRFLHPSTPRNDRGCQGYFDGVLQCVNFILNFIIFEAKTYRWIAPREILCHTEPHSAMP